MIGERNIYSVNEVNRYIKAIISQDENLKFIFVKGEISNFKRGANGHLYFSLKDKEAMISCAMFATYASKLIDMPVDGDEVVVLASADVYPTRGTYQLIVYEMNPLGKGAILVELEKLKKKLQSEGLFDVSRKRSINLYPKAIGVITAPNGAAIRDIVTNIKRRYPIADIYVFPSAVQGENAPKELLKAFNKSQEYELDTLIIGRGGGASEDLSAFNDETLVRAIATSKMPVIAAVGHEIDTTLVDYVADKRASTPTGAAELATIDRREIEIHFQNCIDQLTEALYDKLENMKEDVSSYKEEMDDVIKNKLENLTLLINSKKEQLNALNPKKVLQRGYTITVDSDNNVITSSRGLVGKQIKTYLNDGAVYSTVDKVEEN